jgi:hypothetical protein
VFGVFLFLFQVGHAILRIVLRRLAGPRQLAWSAGISLLLGVAPLMAFAIVGAILSRSIQLLSTLEVFRMGTILSQAILGPYFVLFWFLLLGLLVPLHRRRLARCFGYNAPADEEALGGANRTGVQ